MSYTDSSWVESGMYSQFWTQEKGLNFLEQPAETWELHRSRESSEKDLPMRARN